MGIMLLEYLDVIDQQRPDHPDRITTPRTAAADTGRTHRAAPRGSGQDRARRLDGRVERADRAVAAGVRGHRAQMATPLVRRTGVGGTGRCETVRPPTGVHPRAGRPGQGVGLHPAGRAGPAPVAVVVPGAGRHAVDDGICASISPATVRRWLSEDALKPWQYQSWIFITDPDFAAKAARVLALYDRTWEGKPLGCNDYVISADEKTSIQARCRCHPTLPPGKARQIRVNHDYHRRGAIAYLAAYDVHRGQVFGRCQDTTGIAAFEFLVDQVMTTEPYASAERVFWIVDNGSSH